MGKFVGIFQYEDVEEKICVRFSGKFDISDDFASLIVIVFLESFFLSQIRFRFLWSRRIPSDAR